MLASLASSFGIGAFALPVAAPWSLALCLATAVANVQAAESHKEFLLRLTASSLLCIAAAGLVIPAPLAAALLAAATLAKQRPELAACILVLQSSYVASIQALLANHLHALHIEAASPALVSSFFVLLFFRPSFTFTRLGLLLAAPLVAYAVQGLISSPVVLMFACAIPSLALVFVVARGTSSAYQQTRWKAVTIVLICIGLLGWALTPPRSPTGKYFLLPKNPESVEAKFYQHYSSSANFAGLSLKEVSDPESIPENSLVLLPWLTAPPNDDQGKDLIPRIKELASARSWTVLLIGEHTNMTGVRDRITALTGRNALRNDLSVPPRNSDNSGPIHAADFRAWPHESIFNRGASVEILGLLDRVLLEGDGWWAEPDIGEWLWVGDYLWQPSDRNGRLTLAASIDINKARWVVVGDTSPFVNRQLVSDPRAAAQIIQMATLWPLFIKDLIVLILAAICLFGMPALLASFFPLVILAPVLVAIVAAPHEGKWRGVWLQESGFDERNFNNVISATPGLAELPWSLIRLRHNANGTLMPPDGPAVLFALVDREATIASAKLTRCRRLGALKSDEGPYLMDSQVCAVSGDVEILIGDRDSAAAIRINRKDGDLLLVLDRRFLSQNSPPENVAWLLRELHKQPK